MNCAEVDSSTAPPTIRVPRAYNAAVEFIDRNIELSRGDRIAVIDADGSYSYRDLFERVNRAGNALSALGAGLETRILIGMHDSIDFPAVFWGAIKIGAVPIPVNTLLTTADFDFMLRDSRAKILVISDALYEQFEPIIEAQPSLEAVIVSGGDRHRHATLETLMACASPDLEPTATTSDDIAFWLYTSGSTGHPKGSMHLHRDLVVTAVHYGRSVLDLQADDVIFSAAKLFFAYGLGNAMTFPFYVGGSAVLFPGRPTPDSVMTLLGQHEPTIFFGVPTLYGAILADSDNDRARGSSRLRRCISAGEALPEGVAREWEQRFGVQILDGIGSTEMLHIFLSNFPDDIRYGTTGRAVPGYELRVITEDGETAGPGSMGELWVKGESCAVAYWNQREKSLDTFHGPWTRTGDKYVIDNDGYYQYCGRTDDMLKVSGNWVSPFEVESALGSHEAVLEAAVVGQADDAGLIKPKAIVVLKNPASASGELRSELQQYVKDQLAPYKYPRWIEFVDDLPKTATGKIQRFKLRSGG